MAAYARQAVARSGAGWTVSSNAVTLFDIVSFPTASTGAETVTHFGVGVASSGATALVFFGTVTPNIVVSNGVTPKLSTGTTITQAASDGMTTAAANAFLLLFFNNTDWADIGDAGGLQNSATAGSLYLSLHQSPGPGEGGTQQTNECGYT